MFNSAHYSPYSQHCYNVRVIRSALEFANQCGAPFGLELTVSYISAGQALLVNLEQCLYRGCGFASRKVHYFQMTDGDGTRPLWSRFAKRTRDTNGTNREKLGNRLPYHSLFLQF
jgi:hypothetical protein